MYGSATRNRAVLTSSRLDEGRVDTVHSAENSPRRTKDPVLVQMSIEESFNWSKELKNEF